MQHSPKAKQDSIRIANIEDWNLTKKEKDARSLLEGHPFLDGMQHSPEAKQESIRVANIEDWNLTKKEKRCPISVRRASLIGWNATFAKGETGFHSRSEYRRLESD